MPDKGNRKEKESAEGLPCFFGGRFRSQTTFCRCSRLVTIGMSTVAWTAFYGFHPAALNKHSLRPLPSARSFWRLACSALFPNGRLWPRQRPASAEDASPGSCWLAQRPHTLGTEKVLVGGWRASHPFKNWTVNRDHHPTWGENKMLQTSNKTPFPFFCWDNSSARSRSGWPITVKQKTSGTALPALTPCRKVVASTSAGRREWLTASCEWRNRTALRQSRTVPITTKEREEPLPPDGSSSYCCRIKG